jgi:catechol 2,3-dioxygenase-like lactoylglutathione lyase family enzyme
MVRRDVRRHDRRRHDGARGAADLRRAWRHDHPHPRPAPGRGAALARPIRPYADFSSHNAWGTDHFGFMYRGDLEKLCAELRAKGVIFPVALKRGVNGSLLCYVAAPDGVSIELMQC